jgi:hypothetical protein
MNWLENGDKIVIIHDGELWLAEVISGRLAFGGFSYRGIRLAAGKKFQAFAVSTAVYNDEGTLWLRGWDAETQGALRATYNLKSDNASAGMAFTRPVGR